MNTLVALYFAIFAATFGHAQELSMCGGDGKCIPLHLCRSSGVDHGPSPATWFTPDVGSCGQTNVESDFIVALDAATLQNFPGATANPNK